MTDAEASRLIQPQRDLLSIDRVASAADPMIVFAYECLRREFQSLLAHRLQRHAVPSPDDIHRTRIAARRLRVALRLFKDMLPSGTVVQLDKELRWFARALGDVRDLDVYAEDFRAYRHEIVGTGEQMQQLENYEQHVQRARSEARNGLIPLFSDPRYETLLSSLGEFLANAPSPGALRRWRSFRIHDGARAYLEASVKRVLKRGDKIDDRASAQRLHRLRIKAKRLRYALEFFAEVYPSLARSAQAAKRLQDVLGEHQDACTASNRLRQYLDDNNDGPSPALERLLANQQRKAADARRLFVAEWRRFKKRLSLDELRTLLAA